MLCAPAHTPAALGACLKDKHVRCLSRRLNWLPAHIWVCGTFENEQTEKPPQSLLSMGQCSFQAPSACGKTGDAAVSPSPNFTDRRSDTTAGNIKTTELPGCCTMRRAEVRDPAFPDAQCELRTTL